jgi:type IV pilus assembly protein PilN
MAKINLLPWRQAHRDEKLREFLVILGAVVAASLLAAYLWVSNIEGKIQHQNDRNNLLQVEINKLDLQVKEIARLKKIRDDLLTRIRVIQGLEGTRPLIVRYFDELVRIIPDGLWINNISKKGKVVSVDGVAESYNRIASFMRSIDNSEWFTSHNLTSVVASPKDGEQASQFKLTFITVDPNLQETSDTNVSKKAGNTKNAKKRSGK